jgi:hypothetical protein
MGSHGGSFCIQTGIREMRAAGLAEAASITAVSLALRPRARRRDDEPQQGPMRRRRRRMRMMMGGGGSDG